MSFIAVVDLDFVGGELVEGGEFGKTVCGCEDVFCCKIRFGS